MLNWEKKMKVINFLMFFSTTRTQFDFLFTKVYRLSFHAIWLAPTLSEAGLHLVAMYSVQIAWSWFFFFNNALFSSPFPLSALTRDSAFLVTRPPITARSTTQRQSCSSWMRPSLRWRSFFKNARSNSSCFCSSAYLKEMQQM